MTTSAEYAVMDAAKALQDHLNTAPDRPTLRDQFAMAALGGFATMVLDTSDDRIAAMAYTLADAMMEERNREP